MDTVRSAPFTSLDRRAPSTQVVDGSTLHDRPRAHVGPEERDQRSVRRLQRESRRCCACTGHGHVAEHARCQAGRRRHPARAARRRVQRELGPHRGQGARRDGRRPVRHVGADHRPDRAEPPDELRRLRVLRVPPARHVHRVAEHAPATSTARASQNPSQTVGVTVGQRQQRAVRLRPGRHARRSRSRADAGGAIPTDAPDHARQHAVPSRPARKRYTGTGLDAHDRQPVPGGRRLHGVGRVVRRRRPRGPDRRTRGGAVLARRAATERRSTRSPAARPPAPSR